MEKMDELFNRDRFPEYDPTFWNDIIILIEALEERLLSEALKNTNYVAIGLREKPYEGLGLSERETKTLNRLIFWAACCGMKNRMAVINILYECNLDASAIKNIKKQLMNELQKEDFSQHATDTRSDNEIVRAEKVLASGFDGIHAEKDSFMYGFNCAVDMLIKMIPEYKVFEPSE